MINTLFLTTVPVESTFVAFLQHSQTHFHGLSYQFFQISLKNSELKNTHNAFRDCREIALFPTTFLEIAVYTLAKTLACDQAALCHFNFCAPQKKKHIDRGLLKQRHFFGCLLNSGFQHFCWLDRCQTDPRVDLGVGRGPRGARPPLFFFYFVLFYRILRKIKSIYIAGKQASVRATPF